MLPKSWLWQVILPLIFLRKVQSSTTVIKPNDNDLSLVICHRKVQPGRKMIKLLTERVVNCENLQDCCRACAYEKSFACKGFNHRIDDSQCTCELTSTPYSRMSADEHFLIDTNYDYYEREQNCLLSAPRDGTLYWKDHSKFYEQTTHDTWLNQKDINEDRFHEPAPIDRPIYRDFHPLNREFKYGTVDGSTRYQDQFRYEDSRGFVSPQSPPNWKDNWKNFKTRYSDFVNENTFPDPRINYNKGSYPDLRPSTLNKPPLRDQFVSGQHGLSIPNSNEYPRRRFFNYGNAFGYNDNYVSTRRQSSNEEHEKGLRVTRKCSIKAITGSKLSRNVVRKTCLTHDLDHCEQLCISETDFPCESFAYRYSVLTTNPTDNCLLSDLSHRNLNFYTDLEPDRDYNSYLIIRDSKLCYSKESPERYPLEECFSRIRSGFAIPPAITKKVVFANDLGECQFSCITSREFVCKSLVFKYLMRYRRHVHERAPANCFLSDWPTEEINPVDMLDMDGAELYERSSFSYGCEMYPLPLPIPNIIPSNEMSSFNHMDELCYFEHHRPCKLMPHAVISSTKTITKPECRQKCSAMRSNGVTPCMSFNYINAGDNDRDNCFLSDISMQDLRPNLDYTYDDNHILYAWKDFDPYCSLATNNFHAINITPAFDRYNHPPHRPSDRIHDSTNGGQSKFNLEPYQHDYKYEYGNVDGVHLHGSTGFQHDLASFHPREFSAFQRYTVNGQPCKNGTVCQRNEVAGFWSCEVEEGEDNWDYCCEPNHRCGYSKGYHYPWCYVGLNEDQWRPCSETYNPYYLSENRSFHRQSPKYAARHWPVIYFHEASPPNCTITNSNLYQNNQFEHRKNYRGNGPH